MSSNLAIVLLGLALVVLGIVVASRGGISQRLSNTGGSVTGDVKQSISNIHQTVGAGRETKSRQWIGWGLSVIGLLLSAWGLFGK